MALRRRCESTENCWLKSGRRCKPTVLPNPPRTPADSSSSCGAMPDLDWLSGVWKVLGGTVVGWMGRVLSERGKKRRMRRNLYREIGHNYMRVYSAIEDKSGDLMIRLSANINTSYLDFALKNMDT